MDKNNPADWQSLKPQSIITISDAQGIQDSMRRGLGVRGIDYTVQSIARCQQLNGLSCHLIFTLADSEQTTFLMAKIVDGLVDLYLFFEPPDLQAGTRPEFLDRGMHWLFQEPANPDSFQPSDLRYTRAIRQEVPAASGGPPVELIYTMKAQGELQCNYTETPARDGLTRPMLATVVEYRTPHATENPEFLILETGEQRSQNSFVRFFQGCPVRLTEVDVLGL